MVKNIENLLQPTVDYVFKRIFGHVGNERITKSLLTAILNEEIRNIDLDCNTFINKNVVDDKIGILDVKAKFNNGVTCDIEMQILQQNDIIKRILFYWSKMYAQNIQSGKTYGELKRCIVILIADFELDELKEIEKYLSKWVIKEKKLRKTYVDRPFGDCYNRIT